MDFCSPFDRHLAHEGPAAVFLPDTEGAFRFQPSWTRDAYGRAPGPHEHAWTWTLLRDRGSGFVMVALVTSPSLLSEHPRLDVRVVESLAAATDALQAFGSPPLAESAW